MLQKYYISVLPVCNSKPVKLVLDIHCQKKNPRNRNIVTLQIYSMDATTPSK